MKAIIIDDEPSCIESLAAKIELFLPQMEIIKTYQVAQEALFDVHRLDADVIFLDIEMPGLDGITFAQKANLQTTEIIYTTAHQRYAINAFQVSAFDFLLKPIDRHELVKTIERLTKKLKEKQLKGLKLHSRYNKIAVPSIKGMFFVPLNEILWLEADNNYTTLHLTSGAKLLTSRAIGEYEDILTPLDFFRIHQSTIINLQHLQEYVRGEGGLVILTNGQELEVSRRRKADLLAVVG
ncbi:LytR/AlgR family response regulator transcription factor [Runella sp.]|uniref:LytR/AlgR family response regulator transcription factor n=1 Tax=Runella sp. TaxID=1960881 RepID=UPI003D0FC481